MIQSIYQIIKCSLSGINYKIKENTIWSQSITNLFDKCLEHFAKEESTVRRPRERPRRYCCSHSKITLEEQIQTTHYWPSNIQNHYLVMEQSKSNFKILSVVTHVLSKKVVWRRPLGNITTELAMMMDLFIQMLVSVLACCGDLCLLLKTKRGSCLSCLGIWSSWFFYSKQTFLLNYDFLHPNRNSLFINCGFRGILRITINTRRNNQGFMYV